MWILWNGLKVLGQGDKSDLVTGLVVLQEEQSLLKIRMSSLIKGHQTKRPDKYFILSELRWDECKTGVY